jgi:hypothetical protein
MPDERGARVDLVRERQEQGEIGVEVDRPPRLVGHAPARQAVGADAGGEEQDRAGRRGEDARVGPEQLPELVQHAVVGLARVPERDEHCMRQEQVHGPGPELAVPGHEPVLTDRPLERRHARHQQDDDHHRVGGDQAGQAPERDRDAARRAERPRALGGHFEADRDAEPEPGGGGEHVDDHGALASGPPPRSVDDRWTRRRRRIAPERGRTLGGLQGARGHARQGRQRR